MHNQHRRGLNLTAGSLNATIANNEIRNNVRSGVYIDTSHTPGLVISPAIAFEGNHLFGNGASGVFVGGVVDGVVFTDNRFERNHDIGLDGPSLTIAPILETATYDPVTNTTTIQGLSPYNTPGEVLNQVELWASDTNEHGDCTEGQRFLGVVTPVCSKDSAWPFTATVPGDLRGQFISAITLRATYLDAQVAYDTSEFGRMLPVN